MIEPKLVYCTVRDGGDELHIECRFDDGQKFAAVVVDADFPKLAQQIAALPDLLAVCKAIEVADVDTYGLGGWRDRLCAAIALAEKGA